MKKNSLILVFAAAIITGVIFAYYPAFMADFTNWDDPAYVVNNDVIKDINSKNTKEIFTTYRNGHYHPLTWLSLAIDYKISDGGPSSFHRTNIILHILNVFLLFFFLYFLLKDEWLAFFAAMLFGIHPMAVEAVAWVTERKTVLYAFFMLLSLLSYLQYSDKKKVLMYILSLLFFVLSCFSKSMAVVLPVLLILTDYIRDKNIFSFKPLVNKVPFFAIAIVFGIVSIFAQKDVIQPEHIQEFSHSIGWGAWSFLLYLVKIIAPSGLSALYEYPPDGGIETIKTILGFIVFAGFIIAAIYFYKKGKRTIVFGLLFLLVNLFLVLKFFDIPAGAYYMADRYAYFPAAGLWLAVFSLFGDIFNKKQGLVKVIFVVIAVIFLFASHTRAKTWKSSVALWTDVIEKDDNAAIAFINRGNAYRDENKYLQAIKDYDNAEKINPRYSAIFTNRGYACYMNGQYKEAVRDFSKSLSMDHNQNEVLYNRGLAFYSLKEYEKALDDYSNVLQADPLFIKAYIGKGNVYTDMGKDSLAIEEYSKVIAIDPSNPDAWYNRGNVLAKNKRHKEALEDYNKAIEIVKYNADYLVNRASTYYYLNEFEKALNDFNTVIAKNPSHTNARMNRGTLALRMGNYQVAFDDFSDIINREPKNAEAYLKRGMTILNSNKPTDACRDFAEAYKLGNPLAMNFIGTYCK